VAFPPIAALTVLVAGVITPGYDPMSRTVSRLAVPGMPAAADVDVAISLIAFACVALALRLGPRMTTGRVALAVSGIALTAASLIHLDPASGATTALHRIASAVAVLGLTAAAFAVARDYGRISFLVGVFELALLVIGLALLATPFHAWGAWERCLLALPLVWMVWLAARLRRTAETMPSTEETARASAASFSSSGS